MDGVKNFFRESKTIRAKTIVFVDYLVSVYFCLIMFIYIYIYIYVYIVHICIVWQNIKNKQYEVTYKSVALKNISILSSTKTV